MISVKERGSLGGIFEMTLLARVQERRGVSRIRWYTASGICISWQSDKSKVKRVELQHPLHKD